MTTKTTATDLVNEFVREYAIGLSPRLDPLWLKCVTWQKGEEHTPRPCDAAPPPVGNMRESALAESLAVAEGNLALYWGSASHRNAYMATAAKMLRPLEVRGWRLARVTCLPEVPEVSP